MTDSAIPQEDLRGAAIDGAKWALLEKWVTRLSTLFIFILLGRLVDPVDFGIVAMAMVVVSLLMVLGEGGVPEAIVRENEYDSSLFDTAFWVTVGLSLVLTAVALAASGLIGQLFGQPEVVPILMVLSLTVVLQSLNGFHTSLLRRTFKFKSLAMRAFLANSLGGLAAIVAALINPSAWALVVQVVAVAILRLTLGWLASRYRPSLQFAKTQLRRLLSFGANMIGVRLLTFVSGYGDNFVIGLFLGAVPLGYYTVGFRIFSTMSMLLSGALSTVSLPVFSRLRGDKERLNRAILEVTRLSATLAVPIFVGIAVLADVIIPLVFGQKWEESVTVMRLLAIVGIVNSVSRFDADVLVAMGRVRLQLVMTFIVVGINLAAFVVGTNWGINGVAGAYALVTILIWPFRLLAMRWVTGISLSSYLGRWVRPAIATVAMGVSMLLVRDGLSGLPGAAVATVTATVVYLSVMLLIDRSNVVALVTVLKRTIGERFA